MAASAELSERRAKSVLKLSRNSVGRFLEGPGRDARQDIE